MNKGTSRIAAQRVARMVIMRGIMEETVATFNES
jgi:hypothetical protein